MLGNNVATDNISYSETAQNYYSAFFNSKKFTYPLAFLFILIPILDILNQFTIYFLSIEIPRTVFLIIGWSFAFLLLPWFFWQTGHYLFKLFLLLFCVKVLFHIYYYDQFNFNKDPFIVALMLIALINNEALLSTMLKVLNRIKIPLVFLLVVSIVPFRENIQITALGPERILGLWNNSKICSYYFFFSIFALSDGKLFLKLIYLMFIILIGSRGVMLAAAVYISMQSFLPIISNKIGKHHKIYYASLISLIGLLGAILFYTGLISPILNRSYMHLEPLIYEDISNPQYGSGRTYLNQLILNEIQEFNLWEWIIGRSQTDMLDFYYTTIGKATFPHNDFVTILYTNGLWGLIIYIYYLFIYPFFNKKSISKLAVLSAILPVLILAATTGFYNFYACYYIVPYIASRVMLFKIR